MQLTPIVRILFFLCAFDSSVLGQSAWLEDLQASVYGEVFTPSNAALFTTLYQGETQDPLPQDGQPVPAAVLQPRGTSDVVTAVNIARQNNLTIAAEGGGGGYRNWRIAANGITVDLSSMRGVVIDPMQKLAIAQGGALGGDLLHEAALWGLGASWGDANSTGMGLALGGGIGLSMRAHGLVCDSILGVQLVLANGSVVAVSDASHPELMAAIRGAGTVFGIVTELTFRLFEGIDSVYAGNLMLPDDAQHSTFRSAMNWTVSALDAAPGLGIETWLLPSPAPPLGGLTWVTANYFGPETLEQKADIFGPLRAIGPIQDALGPPQSFVGVNDFVGAFVSSPAVKGAKSFFLNALMSRDQVVNGGVDVMLAAYDAAVAGLGGAPVVILTDWFGPATEDTASMTPFKGAYMHFFISFPAPPDSSQGLGLLSQLAGMLEGHVESIFPYANLATDPNSGDHLATALGGTANLEMVRLLKGQVDPGNLFKNHQFEGLLPLFPQV